MENLQKFLSNYGKLVDINTYNLRENSYIIATFGDRASADKIINQRINWNEINIGLGDYIDNNGEKIELQIYPVEHAEIVKNWENEHDYPHPIVKTYPTGNSYNRNENIRQDLTNAESSNFSSEQRYERNQGYYGQNYKRGSYQNYSRGHNRWEGRRYAH